MARNLRVSIARLYPSFAIRAHRCLGVVAAPFRSSPKSLPDPPHPKHRVLQVSFRSRAPVPACACCIGAFCGSGILILCAIRAMKRIFQKREFDAVAAKATLEAPKEVKKRFHVPIEGTLTCTFAGAVNPEARELLVYNTQVTFEWKLRSSRVQGVVTQAWEAQHAMRMLSGHFVPFKMKRPLVAAHLYEKLSGRTLLFFGMKAPSVARSKVHVHAIAMSKPVTEPFRKTILKPRHGAAIEAPIAARISDDRSLACVPADPGCRSLFHFHRDKLRRVVDDENRKPADSTTHARPLDLPADFTAYDKRPWRCLRDVAAFSEFKAEEIRAHAEGRAFDIDRAMSALVVCPFEWDTTECFNHTTVFVILRSGDKNNYKYRAKAATLRRLCIQAGAQKKRPRPRQEL